MPSAPPEWAGFRPMPRFITRWPEKNAAGREILRMQRLMGTRPMPWQELAAHTIGERLPNGLPRNSFIFITVPRQSGKTTAAGAWMNQRALMEKKSKVWYTAQTGQKARDRWIEMTESITDSIYGPHATIARSNGSEQLRYPNKSQIRPHPPTAESLHSEQSDINIIDEAWSYTEEHAELLMQAITPTQTTRPMRQTIVISTEGTADSTWLHRHIDQARAGDPGIFLIDFGIAATVDPHNLDAVAAAHPAFGYTLDMAALEDAARKLSLAGFARGYGNRRTGAVDSLVPAAVWEAAAINKLFPADSPAFLAAAIDINRTETAIAAATWLGARPFIEIIKAQPGTTWATAQIVKLMEDKNNLGVVIDKVGPSSTLHAAISKAKTKNKKPVKLITPTAQEVSTAAAEIMDRLYHVDVDDNPDPKIWFRTDPALDAAIAIADRRWSGDSWMWSRKGSSGSIAALEAATLALHGLLSEPKPSPPPFLR